MFINDSLDFFVQVVLIKAVKNNRAEIVELLLKAGADIIFKTKVSAHKNFLFRCFILFVCLGNYNFIVTFFSMFFYVFAFFVFGIVCCQYGKMALLLAVEKGNDAVVQLLLNYGAIVNDQNNV